MLIHWFADFVLQTHKQALGKSSKWSCLFGHTMFYSLIWLIFGMIYLIVNEPMYSTSPKLLYDVFIFVSTTFVFHTFQDYFTSRWVKYYFDKKNLHNGFVVIGIDQMLHYGQLILTYVLLNKG